MYDKAQLLRDQASDKIEVAQGICDHSKYSFEPPETQYEKGAWYCRTCGLDRRIVVKRSKRNANN
jgi:hypothetical protein